VHTETHPGENVINILMAVVVAALFQELAYELLDVAAADTKQYSSSNFHDKFPSSSQSD
jgi:hypothetical protein